METFKLKSKKCTYVILAPMYVRPGFDYCAYVVVDNITEPIDVSLVIQRDGCNVAFNKITFVAGAPQEVLLKIPPDVTLGNYEFLAFGSSSSGNFSFVDKANVEFEGKSKGMFIQTDKGIYRAGQLVQYRIFILSPELKPLQTSFNGYIADPNENRIKVFKDIAVNNGVYTGEFQLIDQPPLGDWKINIQLKSQELSKVFHVQEYVLPKFEVLVDLPPFVLKSDKEISAIIKAKYTFGKPVSGKAKILFKGQYSSFLVILYVDVINGEAKGCISMRDLLENIHWSDQCEITVTAEVTEHLTGSVQKGSSTVTLYKDKVQLEVTKSSQYFKPGLKYVLYVKVSMPNERPIPQNLKNRLSVTFSSHYIEPNDNDGVTTMYDVPENGMVTAEYCPPEEFDCLFAEIKYGKVVVTESIYKFTSESKSYIQLIVLSHSHKVGNHIHFEVKSTVNMDTINYIVLSHGTIVASQRLILNNEKLANFSIEAIAAMAPTSCVLVYHVRENGEMIADAVNVKIDGAVQNTVSINMECESSSTRDYSEPGQLVKVHGQTAQESYVGVAAVDQSVILLSAGNDITVKDILDEMDSFNKKNYNSDDPIIFRRTGCCPIGGRDSSDVFKQSGIVVLTNSQRQETSYPCPRPCGMISKRSKMRAMAFSDAAEEFTMATMPLQTNSIQSTSGNPPAVRKYFPETWLWLDMYAGQDGSFTHETTVPDSITTWIATAVSLNSKLGMGASTIPAKLQVFRPFFVSANLPFSIIRGETFTLQVLVFNYLGSEQAVEVTLERSDDFIIANAAENSGFSQILQVVPDQPTTVNIIITPVVVGEIDIKVSAKSAIAGDTEKKRLLVKPEGVTLYFNSPIFLDLTQNNNFNEKIDIPLPAEGLIDGSLRTEVSAIVDILGPTINHLDSLVRMPYGCGEQNMINFVPDVIAAKYLTVIDCFKGAMKEKILKYIEKGYQRQFSYQRGDGSFSAFGNRDKNGSTWLTAFVLKSFQQAKPFTDICEHAFKKGLDWLANQLNRENYFEEHGNLLDHSMQGGMTGSITLTAYVIIAITDVAQQMENKNAVKQSLSYLEQMFENLKSPFEIAVVTYALKKCNSSSAAKAFEKLNSLAVKEDNFVHWGESTSVKPKKCCPYKTSGASIQTTGYALLTTMLYKDIKLALPIVRWLISQMNSSGGFQSTQDTVIGLEALAAFASETHTKDTEMAVTFSSENFSQNLDLKSADSFLLQTTMIPTFPKSVGITATGRGAAFVQVSWKYNIKETSDTEYFDLDISTNTTFFGFSITITPKQKNGPLIGMFVMEITMPSGYSADSTLFSQILEEKPYIGRIEGKNNDTSVVIYYNEITEEPQTSVTIDANRAHIIENLKEVPIVLYAYYEPEKRITRMYKTPEVSEAAV